MSSSSSQSGHVRAGSFCSIGDSGSTEAGTPMECIARDDGQRARWRKKAGAVSASRVRKREPRTAHQRAADKLRPSEINALRRAAGLNWDGAMPRNKSQFKKLVDAGFLDDYRTITDAGRGALRRRGALDPAPDGATPKAEPSTTRALEPAAAAPAEDRSAESGVDWSLYLLCLTCFAAEGRPCHDLRKAGSFNATPHDGRPMTAAAQLRDEEKLRAAQKRQAPPAAPEPDGSRAERVARELLAMRERVRTVPDHRVTREGARDLMAGLTVAELHTVADKIGYPAPHIRAKGPLVAHNVLNSVGHVLTSYSLNPRTRDEPAPAPAGQPASDPYQEARRRDIEADRRRVEALNQAAAAGAVTSHEPGQACPLGLWHTGPCPIRTPADRVHEIYDTVRKRLGVTDDADWIGLADMRDEMARQGLDRAAQDALLAPLARGDQNDALIEQESNQKALTERDRAAALVVGNRPQHMIRFPAVLSEAEIDERTRGAYRQLLDLGREPMRGDVMARVGEGGTYEQLRAAYDKVHNEMRHRG